MIDDGVKVDRVNRTQHRGGGAALQVELGRYAVNARPACHATTKFEMIMEAAEAAKLKRDVLAAGPIGSYLNSTLSEL
jgi:hypothetical protein